MIMSQRQPYTLTSGALSVTVQFPEHSAPQPQAEIAEVAVAERIEASLSQPLGLPILQECTVPGDQVVIVADPETPFLAEIVVQVWEVLSTIGDGGVSITLLLPNDPASADWKGLLETFPLEFREKIAIHIHDPEDEQQRAYLASSAIGERIYLSNHLINADLIVSIGLIGFDSLLGFRGTTSAIYPVLSDADTIQAARRLGHEELTPTDQRPLRELVDEIGWLLGTQFSIQVVPVVGDSPPAIVCGMMDKVMQAGSELLLQSSRLQQLEEETDLLVVSVPGGMAAFDWKHIGTAVEMASRLVPHGGRIAIVADCCQPTGPAAVMLRRSDEPEDLLKPLGLEPPEDGLETLQLIRALRRARIYLYSQLPDEVVEDLGLAPLASEAELQRLIDMSQSVRVISNINYGWADFAG